MGSVHQVLTGQTWVPGHFSVSSFSLSHSTHTVKTFLSSDLQAWGTCLEPWADFSKTSIGGQSILQEHRDQQNYDQYTNQCLQTNQSKNTLRNPVQLPYSFLKISSLSHRQT